MFPPVVGYRMTFSLKYRLFQLNMQPYQRRGITATLVMIFRMCIENKEIK